MKPRNNRKGMLWTIIAALCAVIIACTANFAVNLNANALSTANADNSAKTLKIGELSLSNYDSSTNNVFSSNRLAELYNALTGGHGATLQAVEDTLPTADMSYGSYSIPAYKSAKDLYTQNNKNIVVSFGGILWDAVFLTRSTSGDVILTLWADQLVGATYKFGWATGSYNATINEGTTDRISNAYGTSQLRALGLNGGATSGNSAYYTSATAKTTVSEDARKTHALANFTLDNATLGTKKSLVGYLVQPKDVAYTSYLSYNFLDGNNYSHILNDALTLDGGIHLNSVVGKTNTTFYGSASNGAHASGWWNQGVKNYAITNSTQNGYNDWGTDYVWAPSLPETGYSGCANQSLWATETTGQTQYGAANVGAPSSALAASTNSANYGWLRSGSYNNPYSSRFLSSSGGFTGAATGASLGVRPALHLNLTSAASAASVEKPTANSASTFTYNGKEQTYLPTGYNAAVMEIAGNAKTDAGEYTASVTPKTGLTWTDGTTDPVSFNYKINKATPTVTPVFSGDRPFNTDGFPQPTSYTAGANGINITGTFDFVNQTIECDKSKEYEWTFTPDEEYAKNFVSVTGKQTFNFQERKISSMEVKFDAGGKTVYTKTPKSDLMKMITLTVTYNDGKAVEETNFEISCSLKEGTGNEIVVTFGGKVKTVAVDVAVVKAEVTDLTFVYHQDDNKITPNTPLDELKNYLKVYPVWNYTDDSNELKSEEYTLSGTLTVGSPSIKVSYQGFEKVLSPAPLVVKDSYNYTPVFEDKLAAYTGAAYDPDGWITDLPQGVTVTYSCPTDMIAVGKHTVTATFTGDYENYEAIPNATAVLTIENNYALPEFVEDTLFYNPAGNTFELKNFDGIKDVATLTVNGVKATLEEALTKTEIGEYELTITLKDGKFLGDRTSVTLTYGIVKRKVEAPVFKAGSIVYSGATLTPTALNFDFDGAAAGFVSADSGVDAGSYFAVFELSDTEHYEWATVSASRVSVKKALAEDNAEALPAGQIRVPWEIAKAVVSATVQEGGMPAFTCPTVGNLDSYVTYTYYKDELCTEPIAFGDLERGERYYVKAAFNDENGNFELDDSAVAVINGKAAPYDTTAKEPTFFQKAIDYVRLHWKWFAIGGGALLALILLIIIIAAIAKKRRKTKEEREEKKAKKEEEKLRREEERRMQQERLQAERELAKAKQEAELEKIRAQAGAAAGAGMASTAMQPQPVQQAASIQQQAVPQAMPTPAVQQAQQPVVQQVAPADYSVLAEIRAELAELRARQNTAGAQYANDPVAAAELIRLKAENEAHMRAELDRARSEAERARMEAELERVRAENGRYMQHAPQFDPSAMGGDMQKIGALAVAIWQSMNKAGEPSVEAKPKPAEIAQIAEESVSASAMYPPDAVITTTTTVDTTQNKQAQQREIKRDRDDAFSDLDGFYDAYNE